MATILELELMDSNVYDGTSSPKQDTGPLLAGLPGWIVLNTSSDLTTGAWRDVYVEIFDAFNGRRLVKKHSVVLRR